MSIIKFNRYYILEIMIPIVKDDGTIDKNNVDKITIENPIKCEFNITRDTFSGTNKGSFKLYNLNIANRNKIFQDYMNIDRVCLLDFRAGYYKEDSAQQTNDTLPLLCSGRVLTAYSKKQGTDIITEIEVIDMDVFTANSSITFDAETTREDAIKTLVADLKNTELGDMPPMTDKLGKPFTVDGNTLSAINALCGGGAFIDMGKLHILFPNYVRGQVSIVKIDSSSGLLGTPRRREALCEIDVLFDPYIVVGQLIEIESSTSGDQFNGQFKVVGINHSGSISGAACGTVKTTLTLFVGVELPNANYVLVQNNNSPNSDTVTEVTGSNTKTIKVSTASRYLILDVYNYIRKYKKAPTDKKKYPLTKNISWYELLNRSLSGDPSALPSTAILTNLYATAQITQQFIDKYYPGKKVTINSGWRSPRYNASIGGASNSQHIQGKAIDLKNMDISSNVMFNKAKASGLFGWLGYYSWGIHVDVRNTSTVMITNDK